MKFNCENCQARYQLDDDKVAGRTLRIRCRRCGGDIVVRSTLAATAAASAPTASAPRRPTAMPLKSPVDDAFFGAADVAEATAPSGEQGAAQEDGWYLGMQGAPAGPMSRQDLLRKVAQGTASPSSLVWREGFAEWKALKDIAELAALLAPRQPPATAPRPRGLTAVPPARPSAVVRPAEAPHPAEAAPPPPAQPRPVRPTVSSVGGSPVVARGSQANPAKPMIATPPSRPSVAAAEQRSSASLGGRNDRIGEPPKRRPTATRPVVTAVEIDEGTATAERAVGRTGAEQPPLLGVHEGGVADFGVGLTTRGAAAVATAAELLPADSGSRPMFENPSEPPTQAIRAGSLNDILGGGRTSTPASAVREALAAKEPNDVGNAPSLAVGDGLRAVSVGRTAGSPWVGRLALVGAASFGVALAAVLGLKVLGVGTTPASPPLAAVAKPASPPAVVPPLPSPSQPLAAPVAEPTFVDPTGSAAIAPSAAAEALPKDRVAAVAKPAARGPATKPAPKTAPGSDLSDREQAMLARMAKEEGVSMDEVALPKEAARSAKPQGEGLSPTQLATVVQENRPGLARCYTLAARNMGSSSQSPTIRMDVDVSIGTSGTVTQVGIRSSESNAATLLTCLKQQIKRWRFPAAGDASQVSFPLVFQPGS